MDFTATLVNDNLEVTWTATGGGSLSTKSGLHVIYTPPAGSGMETLTAGTNDGLSASVTIMSGPETLTGATIPGLTAAVTVEYDAEDIPHINCATTIDCLAVQGYIQARDRFFMMDFLRHVSRAHLSEMIGIAGLEQDVQLRTLFVTRAGHRLEDDLVAVMDPQTKTLTQAFVGGINAYLVDLRAHPGNMPGEYAQLPFALTPADIADWTLQDTMAMARLQQFQLSETIEEETGNGQFFTVYGKGGPIGDLGKVNTWIRAAAPTTEQAHTLSVTGLRAKQAASPTPGFDLSKWKGVLSSTKTQFDALRRKLRPAGASVGSNNWVVASSKSANHAAMVANDPHLSLQYPPLFHLSVMTSATASENLNLAGGAFPGIPGALVGRGAHVGWGVTVVGYDVTDVYLETFQPQASCPGAGAGPPCVRFKGANVSVVPAAQTYKIRVGPGDELVDSVTLLGTKAPPQVVLIVPHHGPIVQAAFQPDGSGAGVSVRWTGQEGNTQDIKAFFGLNTAIDVDAAVESLKLFATGAQNFVLADDQGHIAYDPHALVPVRGWTTTASAALAPPWFPLPGDGATIDTEWGDGVSNCASATLTPVPATCWIADSALPFGKDPAKGYFFTANADPTATGVSDDNNPLAHPPYLSFDWDDSSGFRATRIQERLEDTLGANGSISIDDMESIQADHVSRPGKVFTDIIAALPTSPNDPTDLVDARIVLATWATNGWDCPSGLIGTDPVNSPVDPTPAVVANSSGCFLFHEFLRVLLTNVFTDDLAVAKQDVDGLQALKGMIFMLDPTTPANQTKFCNNVDATGAVIPPTHTCAEQVVTALITAYDTLTASIGKPETWVWGRVHTIQPVSLLQLVTTNYSPGPYARPGGAFTVDVGSPALSGSGLAFGYAAGGNVRHVSVMNAAQPLVEMQLPGPERDNPDLFLGPDLLGQWVKNTYFNFAFGNQIDGAAVSTQSFTAQ